MKQQTLARREAEKKDIADRRQRAAGRRDMAAQTTSNTRRTNTRASALQLQMQSANSATVVGDATATLQISADTICIGSNKVISRAMLAMSAAKELTKTANSTKARFEADEARVRALFAMEHAKIEAYNSVLAAMKVEQVVRGELDRAKKHDKDLRKNILSSQMHNSANQLELAERKIEEVKKRYDELNKGLVNALQITSNLECIIKHLQSEDSFKLYVLSPQITAQKVRAITATVDDIRANASCQIKLLQLRQKNFAAMADEALPTAVKTARIAFSASAKEISKHIAFSGFTATMNVTTSSDVADSVDVAVSGDSDVLHKCYPYMITHPHLRRRANMPNKLIMAKDCIFSESDSLALRPLIANVLYGSHGALESSAQVLAQWVTDA